MFHKRRYFGGNKIHIKQLDMCLWNMDAPVGNNVKIWENLLVLHFDFRPHPKGKWCQWNVRSSKLNLQSKFGYCITTQSLNIALHMQVV